MTSIIAHLPTHETTPPSKRIERHLEDLLAHELALSLARKTLVLLDRIPGIEFTVKLSAYKHAVTMVIISTNTHRGSMLTALENLASVSYSSPNTIILGLIEEPHVHITFIPISKLSVLINS